VVAWVLDIAAVVVLDEVVVAIQETVCELVHNISLYHYK
jgi:hypothetical protein